MRVRAAWRQSTKQRSEVVEGHHVLDNEAHSRKKELNSATTLVSMYPKASMFQYMPSRSGCPGSKLACGQWLLQLSPSRGPLQSSTRVQCAAGDNVRKERKQNYNAIKEKELLTYSQTPLFTLKTLCRPSGVGSLASTLFKSSCSAAKVSLYNTYMNLTKKCYFDNSSIGINCFQHI